tara:strand:+ start:170 stop:382 length:213 start_codon:yes stop_codon:yes gene_type:complete
MKATPYNTGKVLIGKSYVPPKRHEVSPDMYEMQSVLLGEPKQVGVAAWAMRAITVVGVAVLLLDLFIWRP